MLKTATSVKGGDLVRTALVRLTDVLREVPFLAQATIAPERLSRDVRTDFVLSLRSKIPARSRSLNRRLICDVKASGQPRIVREACLILAESVRSDKRAYPVFIAPYISPASAEICQQYDTGYLDLAGNCSLAFDTVFIRREGFPNRAVQRRDLRSLYSPKAERVLRVLLASGKRTWRTQELADAADVSLGQVASVKKLLADREWIQTLPAGFGLQSLDAERFPLLEEWARNYRPARNFSRDFYSLKAIPEVEASLTEAGRSQKVPVAFTGFSGAARFAPAVRYQRVSAYVGGDVDAVAKELGLKPVPSGANVTLITPYDDGVFFGTRKVEGAPVVSPVQIYLDLIQNKGRGEEAASAILEEVIKPLWR